MPKRGGASRYLAMGTLCKLPSPAKSRDVLPSEHDFQKHYSEGRPGRGGHDKVFLGLISHIYRIL